MTISTKEVTLELSSTDQYEDDNEKIEEATVEAGEQIANPDADVSATVLNVVEDGLDKPDLRSEIYVIENRDQTVATAKSQFAEEYDVEYSNITGKIIDPGYSASYPRLVVVVERYE